MQPIVTLTINPAVDVSAEVDQVAPERKLRCSPPRYEPGGGGLNVSRAIRKLGGDSVALYACGGGTGLLLSGLLDQEELTHQAVPVAGETRENLAVFETASGLQYRFNMPGPHLSEAEWQRFLDALAALHPRPAYIVASGGLPRGVSEEFYGRVARVGQEIGARVIVDTHGAALAAALREQVFLIKPNRRELALLLRHENEDDLPLEAAVDEVMAWGRCDAMIVSLGSDGALLATANSRERLPSPTVPIRSKVGAGDSMVAGIVLALARGEPLPDAARRGIAAGAAAVMTSGSELCRGEDAERLYQKMRVKE